MKRILIFVPFLCLISCTQYVDVETIVEIKERNVLPELVEQTRRQLTQRLQDAGFRVTQIRQGEQPTQLVISTMIEAEDKSRHREYHNLFRKGELGMWHTYRLTDIITDKERQVLTQLPKMPDLRLNIGQYVPCVIASSERVDSLSVFRKRLQKYLSGVANARLLWSQKPYTPQDDYYVLYSIDTRGQSTAPISNQNISDARADIDPTRNIYAISLNMNKEGAVMFGQMTRQAVNREIAIVVDGRVVSAPTVQAEVKNGRVEITGNFTPDEAMYLSNLFSKPPLPYTLKIIDEKITQQE